jgi:hypothetical protein
MADIKFDDAPESKQFKSIDSAGIHRNFILDEAEFQPLAPKMEKKKVDGKDVEVDTGKTIGPWAKFNFKCDNPTQQFVCTLFAPPAKEEDIKFYGDVYEKGIPIRKKTAAEQIKSEFTNKYYFYEQLAKAMLISPEKFKAYKDSVGGDPQHLFKLMFDKFFALFPLDKLKGKAIDIKTIWNNNIKAKTSFLQLAYPSASNLVFAPYIPNRDTLLSFTQSEQKSLRRQFNPNDKAPTGDATEVNSDNQWKPVASEGAEGEEVLF